MLLLSLFLPPGMAIDNTVTDSLKMHIFLSQPCFTAGSTTVIVVPLTSIGEQLKMECTRLGLSAIIGGQVVAH